jgi:ABC-type multidrug transport system ATPase subunit
MGVAWAPWTFAEVVGLIGRKGGGKTTLLEIRTRITRPTDWL